MRRGSPSLCVWVLLCAACLCPRPCAAQPAPYRALFERGDANGDAAINIADAIAVLGYLFGQGRTPSCRDALDANDDGDLNIADAVAVLGHLFGRAGPLPAPAGECGPDPSPDTLTCQSFGPCEFASLVASYNVLTTIAGRGLITGGEVNGWRPEYEGGPAVDAELSRPHMALSDANGNLYIADKDAHAIRVIRLDGTIHTVAGMNVAGDDGDDPGPGAARHLSSPNGIWVRPDGTVYILDLGNSAIRKLFRDGTLTTMFRDPAGIAVGRGLWVSNDERLVYYASGFTVKRWTPAGGIEVVASGFSGLGNLVVAPDGDLVVTDRGSNRVYRVTSDGDVVPIAGNGSTFGGGDGMPALQTALAGVRGVWFHPLGGYLLGTHEGSQVWYVDAAGTIHLFLDGRRGSHGGDGEHFLTPGFKISEARSVALDATGHVIVVEHDGGFIRKIERRDAPSRAPR